MIDENKEAQTNLQANALDESAAPAPLKQREAVVNVDRLAMFVARWALLSLVALFFGVAGTVLAILALVFR